ncbi:crossover junction endodeoxyribonuclease RuvC [Roseospira visakhapatnamensis]|uniref:Holliday junction resolvasome RuvABC endonuclease subunit n=1 Tax=Roseospira visakhapatnamensis TaxID=390880 RepID=A0A7W6RG66_9PROT|nr:hypothetical protein [Roseospira visakhapatnamensis]MBB4267717.1 Holliday junction resolvasome RuvABC endonuclease subunit [Roseospira visakhapatnamensis]
MSDTFLALDLGTKTGWAVSAHGRVAASGTQPFNTGRFDGGGMRYLRFRHWLDEVLVRVGGELAAVHFEEVRRHAATDAAHVYGGLLATLTAWCEERRIPYQGVPVGTWKRHIVGKGNASKDKVKAEVDRRGFAPSDDNEADAIAIALWVAETDGGAR